jgi:ribonuclease P protein component
VAATLPKSERLCGKTSVAGLLDRGRGGVAGCLRYRFVPRPAPSGEDAPAVSRFLVSVPKRSFKRAVKRNLLKRRIREAYRLQKQLLPVPVDVMFVYLPREVLPSADISASMTAALAAIAASVGGGQTTESQ